MRKALGYARDKTETYPAIRIVDGDDAETRADEGFDSIRSLPFSLVPPVCRPDPIVPSEET